LYFGTGFYKEKKNTQICSDHTINTSQKFLRNANISSTQE